MSNTVTLGQRKRVRKLALEAQEAENKVSDYNDEIALLNSFKQRVDNGQFKSVDAARAFCSASVFDVDPSVETADALEAFLSLDRDWVALNDAYEQRISETQSLEEKWAQARADLQRQMGGTHKGNGFQRIVSLTVNGDGSATIPADMMQILLKATEWCNKGKIQKVSGFVNATESGAITLEVKVSNPAKG